MSKPAVGKFSFPKCICRDENCIELRKKFHERNDLLLRYQCPTVSFTKPKGGQRDEKTEKRKQIYEVSFGRKLEYGIDYKVAHLHFPVSVLEYCHRLREQRKDTNKRTNPSAAIAESDMIKEGLEAFAVEEYETRYCTGNRVYFIPPCVSVPQVEYGLAAEQALARIQVDPLDIAAEMVSGNSPVEDLREQDLGLASLAPPLGLSEAVPSGRRLLPYGKIAAHLIPGPDTLKIPPRTLYLDTIDDWQEEEFENWLKEWVDEEGCDEISRLFKKGCARSALDDLKRHQDFVSRMEQPRLPTDACIVDKFSSCCSFSGSTVAKYQEWKYVIESTRKTVNDRLLVSLAKGILHNCIERFEVSQLNPASKMEGRGFIHVGKHSRGKKPGCGKRKSPPKQNNLDGSITRQRKASPKAAILDPPQVNAMENSCFGCSLEQSCSCCSFGQDHPQGFGELADDRPSPSSNSTTNEGNAAEVGFPSNEPVTIRVVKQAGVDPGLALSKVDDKLVVTKVIITGIFAETELTEDMEIASINGIDIAEKSAAEAISMLKEARGSLTIVALRENFYSAPLA